MGLVVPGIVVVIISMNRVRGMDITLHKPHPLMVMHYITRGATEAHTSCPT